MVFAFKIVSLSVGTLKSILHLVLFLVILVTLNNHLVPFQEALPVPFVQVTLPTYPAVVGKLSTSSPFMVIAKCVLFFVPFGFY